MTMNIKAVIIFIVSYPFESFKLIYGSCNKEEGLQSCKNKMKLMLSIKLNCTFSNYLCNFSDRVFQTFML